MKLNRVKFNLNRTVIHNGAEYTLTGVTLRMNKKTNEFYYQAELQCLKARSSLLICMLEDVEEI